MIIEVLYPEIADLYGDLANVEYLTRCSRDITVHATGLGDEPLFARVTPDLVYLGGTTEAGQAVIAERLRAYASRIEQLIVTGTPFLVTGNALEIFGTRIEDGAGGIDGLGLTGLTARRDMINRHNSLFMGDLDGLDHPVVGFKSQFSMSYGTRLADPLFRTRRGVGLGPDIPEEGWRIGNFMATYLIGPVLVLNPAFALYVLRLMGVEDPQLAYADQMWESYNARRAEFEALKSFGH